MTRRDVVVVGAGTAGLAAARYLRSEGFAVTVLEAHDDLGGQWNRDNPRSGVWPQMRTNTAAFLTRLSDVPYPTGTAVFPRNDEVLAMLRRYADRHDLHRSLRLGAAVEHVGRSTDGTGYTVQWVERGEQREATAARVVVASGRYHHPEQAPVPGLDRFAGRVSHAFHYGGPDAFRGRRVLVCGGSISALEVACDLALGGAREVHLAQRRQRYVMPKMFTGTPVESYVFTRALAEALTTTPPEQLRVATAARVANLAGNPRDYGAPAPADDLDVAGVTGSPHYLNLVAEDRISVHPWPTDVAGNRVTLGDGPSVEVDEVVVATGFDLHLPFLAADLARDVGLHRKGLELAEFTFHPDAPGLAFAGLWAQLGPYAVPLEQQARWIAYTWSGRIPEVPDLWERVAASRVESHHVGYREQHEMALRFARLAGVDPVAVDDALLAAVLPRAAMSPDTFRLVGPDADPGAAKRLVADFRRFGSPEARREVADLVGGA